MNSPEDILLGTSVIGEENQLAAPISAGLEPCPDWPSRDEGCEFRRDAIVDLLFFEDELEYGMDDCFFPAYVEAHAVTVVTGVPPLSNPMLGGAGDTPGTTLRLLPLVDPFFSTGSSLS